MIDQNLLFEQFEGLTSEGNIELIGLNKTFISYSNDEIVPLENLFDCLPNVKRFRIFFDANSFFSHKNATKKVPPKLKQFQFCQVRENYNVEESLEFVQNNQQIYFVLELSYSRPVELLQDFTHNLIQTWSLNFKPPYIEFEGQTQKSKKELEKLAEIYRQQNHLISKNEI
uniref:Uncharacterized protein n=1 Tax=Panagrolaimus sp. PS1159 TaxID=55785 RepID=A0AC35GTG0_9BILA